MGSALKIRNDLTPLERSALGSRAFVRSFVDAGLWNPESFGGRCPGLMSRGLRGWIAKRFATTVVHYNSQSGLEGLARPDPKGYSPRRLTADEEAALAVCHHRRAGA